MTRCIPENFSTWLVDWSLVTGNTMPPRDPDDDDDDDERRRRTTNRTTSRLSLENPTNRAKDLMSWLGSLRLGHLDRRCPARPADRGLLLLDSLLHGGHLVESRRRMRACALVVRKSEKRRAQTVRTPDSGIVSSKLGASSPFGAIRQTSRRRQR